MEISPELAELSGVIVGDGHISKHCNNNKGRYKIEIFGDKINEMEYFEYISDLIETCFARKPILRIQDDGLRLTLNSKQAVEILEEIGLPVGGKSKIVTIPTSINKDKELRLHFLKGLADADFSMTFKKGGRKAHSYPRITGEFASLNIIQQIRVILEDLDIGYYYSTRNYNNNFGKFKGYRLDINGRKRLEIWMQYIGFNNGKHTSKIYVWRKYGYCPPNTTYKERLELLK